MTYSDEKLIALLNGDLPDDESQEIYAAMLMDEELQRRSMSLDPVSSSVRSAMQHIPKPSHLNEMARSLDHSSVRPPKAFRGLGIAASLIAGVLIGWQFLPQNTPPLDWRVEVSRYQALYVAETLDEISPTKDALVAQFKRASAEVDLLLDPERLANLDSISLKRAQILGFQGIPLVQIAYRNADGQPIALCIVKIQGDVESQMSMTMAGMASVSWNTKNHQFILIGGQDQSKIDAIAAQLQNLI
jgi:anti-sigma factor RsiW